MSVSDLPPEPSGDQPEDELVFDEAFVAAARYHEDAAQDRLARLAQINAAHDRARPWRAGEPAGPVATSPRRRKRRDRLLVLLLLAVIGLAVLTLNPGLLPGQPATRTSARQPPTAPTSIRHGTVRQLPAPPVPVTGTSYAFIQPAGDGLPAATWNPCDPIHYVVHTGTALPGADVLLRSAIDQVSAATGLRFVPDGAVPEGPSDGRPSYQPLLYGNTWSPVLISWSDPTESPRLDGDTTGYARPLAYAEPGQPARFVSGTVVLDAPQLARLLPLPDGPEHVKAVMMHELGHLVGLDHTPDSTQLMYETALPTSPTHYADGDLHGLALLGQGSCS